MSTSSCVIGVGSPHGDDQIGWLIADRLALRGLPQTRIEKVVSPLEILDRIDDLGWLGICDACRGAGAAGTWNRWTWPAAEILHHDFAGSHDVGLTAVLDLAARLGRLPPIVVIWGVEVAACQPASQISLTAQAVVERVADAIIQELASARG